jgi:predicted dehydrogenase
MNTVRVGVIGIGSMGSAHAKNIFDGNVPGAVLSAVCTSNTERLAWAKEMFGGKVRQFTSVDALLASDAIDGVIVATPHFDHPALSVKCLEHGLHLLVEKPSGVRTSDIRVMNSAAARSGKVFSIMYNQRTNPLYQKVREMVTTGELGAIHRTSWIITNWFRSQSYYNSSRWRATWAGEGGGVLINQSLHQLDLWQWIVGMPVRVRASMSFGKYHTIEVEDDVTVYVEYENGTTGTFITSTGESPGSNRLEIAGDMGKIEIEDDRIIFWKNHESAKKFNAEYEGLFGHPEFSRIEIPVEGTMTGHVGIIANWVDVILHGTELLAPGSEGIHAVMLSNAMHLSAWTDGWSTIPVDEEKFNRLFQEKVDGSSFKRI